MAEPAIKEWNFDPQEILNSPRKVKGIFHQPVIDKDGEIINSKGMREAVPDFMHLPALHDFHKERPVGLATKVQELGGGRFYMEGVIKATHDCDDVWEKVKTGNYGQMSIFGKRTKYNNQCALPQSMRSGPCITDGVRLDSISICDENARNPQTSLEVAKAKVVFDAEELRKADIEKGRWDRSQPTHERSVKIQRLKEIDAFDSAHMAAVKDVVSRKPHLTEERAKENYLKNIQNPSRNEIPKAETAGESSLMHTPTDYAGGKVRIKKCPRCKEENSVTTISKEDDVEKSRGYDTPKERVRADAKFDISKYPAQEKMRQRDAAETMGRMMKKADDDQEPEAPEKHPAKREMTVRHASNEKSTYGGPFKETGGSHPKRTKSGYPIPSGKNIPPKRENPVGKKGVAPGPETEMRERGTAADAIRHYESEASREKMSGKRAKELREKHPGIHRSIGKPITPRAHTPKRGEEHMTSPTQKTERGTSTAKEQAASALARHKEQQTRFDKADTMDDVEKGTVKENRKGRGELRGTKIYSNKGKIRLSEGVGQEGYSRKESISQRDLRMGKNDDVEKGKRPEVTEEPVDEKKIGTSQPVDKRVEPMEKADTAEDYEEESYDEDEDDDFEHLKPSNKEGNWNKSKNPNGTPGLKKAKADNGPDDEDEEEDEEYEEDEKEDESEIDKAVTYTRNLKPMERRDQVPIRGSTRPLTSGEGAASSKGHKKGMKGSSAEISRKYPALARPGNPSLREGQREATKEGRKVRSDVIHERVKKGDEDASSELFDPSTVSKGEQMVDETEQNDEVEFVSKALVPIEEIDTIVKARTEEISKAYLGQLDEIKKAYDEKVGTLEARIVKMEEETIRKGGSVIVIPELLGDQGGSSMSNADAVARMQQARR